VATKKYCPCFEKAADDEPIFVLRGQDVLAPMVVEYWAELAAKLRVNPPKILEAYQCAQAMREYERRKVPD
jgi:hypothetical protein